MIRTPPSVPFIELGAPAPPPHMLRLLVGPFKDMFRPRVAPLDPLAPVQSQNLHFIELRDCRKVEAFRASNGRAADLPVQWRDVGTLSQSRDRRRQQDVLILKDCQTCVMCELFARARTA